MVATNEWRRFNKAPIQLLITETVINAAKVSKAISDICHKTGPPKSLHAVYDLVAQIEHQRLYKAHLDGHIGKSEETSKEAKNPFDIVMNIVNVIGTLEQEMIRKLIQSHEDELNFQEIRVKIECELPPQVKVNAGMDPGQIYFGNKYEIPFIGADLIVSADSKVKIIRSLPNPLFQELKLHMYTNDDVNDQFFDAFLQDIFGNLPLTERLTNLNFAFSLYELLTNDGLTSKQGIYLRESFANSLATPESRAKFLGAYLLGSTYPKPVARSAINFMDKDHLLFIQGDRVYLPPNNPPSSTIAPAPTTLLKPFETFQRMFEVNSRVINEARGLTKVKRLRMPYYPHLSRKSSLLAGLAT